MEAGICRIDWKSLMISSPNRHDLVFPKGGWETDESVCEAACREAFEEAGVKGIINDTILGIWEFRSRSRENSCNLEGACRGYMFAMEVTEELEWWPEQSSHKRRWVDVRESLQLCRYEWMREALGACIRFLSSRNAALPTTKRVDNSIDAYCSSIVKLELSFVP